MAVIRIDRETENDNGWQFEVTLAANPIEPASGSGGSAGPTSDSASEGQSDLDRVSRAVRSVQPEQSPVRAAAAAAPVVDGPIAVTVLMSWADYDLWSDGLTAPEEVVRNVISLLLSRRPVPEVPTRFDAATIRRWYPDADPLIKALSRPRIG